ncbi:hypothetical protein V6N13_088584 [Hibiscus sabdariffa]
MEETSIELGHQDFKAKQKHNEVCLREGNARIEKKSAKGRVSFCGCKTCTFIYFFQDFSVWIELLGGDRLTGLELMELSNVLEILQRRRPHHRNIMNEECLRENR